MPKREIQGSGLPAPMRDGAFSAGMDADGKVVGEDDVRLQTKTVLENVKAALEAAGGSLRDIVKVTVFLRDMGDYDEIHEVRQRYFQKPYPASSTVEVSALIDPRLLVEMEAVAVIEGG